jgi:hypothetical protein
MFDETKKYKKTDHFFLRSDGNLDSSCNAPKTGNGVFVVYQLKHGRIDLVLIGSSGKIQKNGSLKNTDSLYNSIVKDPQFGLSWISKIKNEDIDGLDIYWYETFNQKTKDSPTFVQATLLQKYWEIYGRLPDWNKEF